MDEPPSIPARNADLEALPAENASLRAALTEARRHLVSEEMLRVFFDLASVGMVYVNPQGTLVKVNPAYCKITGYTPDELIGMPVLNITHPDDRPAETARFQTYLHGQSDHYTAEKRYLRKDGAVRWVSVNARLVPDEHGRPRFSIGVIEDITDRKNAESVLQTTVRRFHTILSNMYPAVLLMTDEGRVEYVNDPFCREFGLSEAPSQLLGLSSDEIIAKIQHAYAAPEQAAARIRDIRARGLPVRGEEVALHDGRTSLRDFVPLQIDDRTYGRLWFQTDITESKLAENALRQSEAHRQVAQAVEIERQRLHSVLDFLPAYVVLLSSDYHVRFANRFFEDRFGKSGSHSFFEHVSDPVNPCPHCQASTPFQTHQPHHWSRVCSDGRSYDIYDFPFTDADGSNLILEVGLDITATKNAQAALQQLNDTLEKRVAERTAELLQANEDLSRINRAAVNRELRMIELKKQINRLCLQAGHLPPYAIAPEDVP